MNNENPTPTPTTPVVPVSPVVSSVVTPTPTIAAPLDQRDQVFAALSYASFLFIVPLIGRRKELEVLFNAKQGMVLFIAEVIIWFVLFILEMLLLGKFSGLGTIIFYGIAGIFWLIPLIFSLMGIYYVFNGKHWLMPIIGKIAQKLQL